MNNKFLRRKPVSLNVLYHFDYEQIPGIRGSVWIVLDQGFALNDSIDLNFIPKFLTADTPSTFISKKRALEVAINSFKHELIKIEDSELGYKTSYRKYIYSFMNKLSENEVEVVEIDALTSEVLSTYFGYTGIKIR